jgi:hypothetical protein
VSDNEWDIYAPRGLGQSLRETLAGQMQYTYFPITLEQLGANIRYHELVAGSFQIADVTVRTPYLNHRQPGGPKPSMLQSLLRSWHTSGPA